MSWRRWPEKQRSGLLYLNGCHHNPGNWKKMGGWLSASSQWSNQSICWTRGSEHWKDLRTYFRKYLFPLVNVLFLQWSIFYIHYKFSLNTISRIWCPICPLHSKSKDKSIRFSLSIFSWSRLIVLYWDMHTHVFLQIVNHVRDGPIGRKNLEYQLDFWVMCVLVCVWFGTLPILPRATQQEVLLGIIPMSLAWIHTNSR